MVTLEVFLEADVDLVEVVEEAAEAEAVADTVIAMTHL
jgi:hypothetical protein